MASIFGSIWGTPRGSKHQAEEPSSQDTLSQKAAHSSPIVTSLGKKDDKRNSGKKLKRRRSSTDASPELGSDESSRKPKDVALSQPAPMAPMDTVGGFETPVTAKSPSSVPKAQKQQDTSGGKKEDLWTIQAITKHRWVDDSIELRIQWDTGDATWEQEVSIQEDTPALLFAYWADQGGRPPHPKDPDLFHIFAIRDIKPRAKKLLVEWVGYKEQSWEPRSTVEEAAPEILKDFEERRSRGRKRRRRQ